MSSFDRLSLIMMTVGIAINLALFALFALQLRELRRQVEDSRDATNRDHDRRRAQATVEFYEATLEKRVSLSEDLAYDRDGKEIRTLTELAMKGDEVLSREISEYLNLMELLATGVSMDTFDFKTIERIAGGGIMAIARHYGEWIRFRRERSNCATLYIEIDSLANRIAEYRAGRQTPREDIAAAV